MFFSEQLERFKQFNHFKEVSKTSEIGSTEDVQPKESLPKGEFSPNLRNQIKKLVELARLLYCLHWKESILSGKSEHEEI